MTGVADTVTHRLVSVPGGRIHLAEQGRGPQVAVRLWFAARHVGFEIHDGGKIVAR